MVTEKLRVVAVDVCRSRGGFSAIFTGFKDHVHALPLSADKMGQMEFSVFWNDEIKDYDTIRSAWEFARNQEQLEVFSSIRLEVMLFQSEDGKKRGAKRVWKSIHPIALQNERQRARQLTSAEKYQKWRRK